MGFKHDTEEIRCSPNNAPRYFIDTPGTFIDTPEHWAVRGITDATLFFRHLPLLLEPSSGLYLEGFNIPPEAREFYQKHRKSDPMYLDPHTVYPEPETYHLEVSDQLLHGFAELLGRLPKERLFRHICGYEGKRLTFWWHDAFESDLLISGDVPEDVVTKFCGVLNVTFSRDVTVVPDINPVVKALLYAADHPERVEWSGNVLVVRYQWWHSLARKMKSYFRKLGL